MINYVINMYLKLLIRLLYNSYYNTELLLGLTELYLFILYFYCPYFGNLHHFTRLS